MPSRTCAKRFVGTLMCVLGPALAVCAEPAGSPQAPSIVERLTASYPDAVRGGDAQSLTFADGTVLPLDDGRGNKNSADWLSVPDIEDMFRYPYPAGATISAPVENFDPGRARAQAFFTKIYGDCRKDEVIKNLVDITWLPSKNGTRLKATRINGVAAKLQAVSNALDKLPKRFDVFLTPPAGTYNCRAIAGTTQLSAHGYGIAIDIATAHAHYWRWSGGSTGPIAYRNNIPPEIVEIFEQHGFIWGGRWHHYDTMHFEYRPELFLGASGQGSGR